MTAEKAVGGRLSGSAGSGGGPQAEAVGGEEVVGQRVPERMGLRLDQTADREKTEAVVLAVGVDPLDALSPKRTPPGPPRSPCARATP
jgi:hypothetical protein